MELALTLALWRLYQWCASSSSGGIINQVAFGGTGTGTVEAVPMVGSSSGDIINQVAVCGTGTGTVEAVPINNGWRQLQL